MESREQPRSALSRLLGAVLVTVVVAGVTLTLLTTQHYSQPGAGTQSSLLGSPLRISTGETAGIYCPSAAAFSPDGTQVVVIGAVDTCADANSANTLVPHVLALYDTRSGALLQSQALDPLIGVHDGTARGAQRVRAVRYVALGWSPDDRHVGMVYAAFDAASRILPDDLLDSGFLLVDTRTGGGTSIQGDAGFFAAPTSSYSGLPVWDLAHGAVSPPLVPAPSLAYAWSADGQPEAILPLSASMLSRLPVTAGPRYPIGNPDGDSTYTIWQTGMIMGRGAAPPGSDLAPDEGAFISWYPAWSPNGTAVTLMVTGVALPTPAGASGAAVASDIPGATTSPSAGPTLPTPQSLTRVPARDAALRIVQQEAGAAGWAVVAWNPAGTLLASINCTTGESETLRLRETGAGAPAGSAALPLGASDPGCHGSGGEYSGAYPNPNLWLQWSADGSHLLVDDQAAGTVAVWSVLQPPA